MAVNRLIRIDRKNRRVDISSEYNSAIISAIKQCEGRQWLGDLKIWRVPLSSLESALTLLRAFDFRVEDSGESGGGETAAFRVMSAPATESLTVSSLNALIRGAISNAFPRMLWVIGIISGLKTTRGNSYFDLVEQNERDESVAQIPCSMFSAFKATIDAKLRKPDGGYYFILEDGLDVRLGVTVDFWQPSGRLSLKVLDIDADYYLGKLARAREKILEKLRLMHLHERNINLPMPTIPLRVAVISGAESEGLKDFLGVLKQSGYAFDVDFYASAVQGKSVEAEMCRALELIESAAERYDVVAIVRGGGSRSELACFDNFEIAVRVAKLSVKVMIGIGHTRDEGVLDMIAEPCNTPTGAAEKLVRQVAAAEENIRYFASDLSSFSEQSLRRFREELKNSANRLSKSFVHSHNRALQNLRMFATSLTERCGRQLSLRRVVLSNDVKALRTGLRVLEWRKKEIKDACAAIRNTPNILKRHRDKLLALRPDKVNYRLLDARNSLDVAARELRAKSNAILKFHQNACFVSDQKLQNVVTLAQTGYVRLRKADGSVVKSVYDAKNGELLFAHYPDGTIKLIVNHETE